VTNRQAWPARLLWDQGGLWSLMALEAHEALGLPLAPLSAAEVAAGGLAGARLLVVPGGWPALKAQALGPAGSAAIQGFVEQGGVYLGFCGGAGLALSERDGLGLVELGRCRGRGRLPSLSGPLWVEPGPGAGDHPLWQGIASPAVFQVWWPGQFQQDLEGVARPLAVYRGPAPGLCSADLRVDQVEASRWPELERRYGIRLDPRGLAGRTAVIEARVGRGLVLLSYLHLDTPGDPAGAQALANLWQHWLDVEPGPDQRPAPGGTASALGEELAGRAEELWRLGGARGLWQERHALMPLWRRGVRGLELWTLARLTRALAERDEGRAEDLLAPLGAALAPVWRDGPAVLDDLARGLDAGGAGGVTRGWFPAPRRVGGDLARALAGLEGALLALEQRRRGARD
jgi:hypothetical protein